MDEVEQSAMVDVILGFRILIQVLRLTDLFHLFTKLVGWKFKCSLTWNIWYGSLRVSRVLFSELPDLVLLDSRCLDDSFPQCPKVLNNTNMICGDLRLCRLDSVIVPRWIPEQSASVLRQRLVLKKFSVTIPWCVLCEVCICPFLADYISAVL